MVKYHILKTRANIQGQKFKPVIMPIINNTLPNLWLEAKPCFICEQFNGYSNKTCDLEDLRISLNANFYHKIYNPEPYYAVYARLGMLASYMNEDILYGQLDFITEANPFISTEYCPHWKSFFGSKYYFSVPSRLHNISIITAEFNSIFLLVDTWKDKLAAHRIYLYD